MATTNARSPPEELELLEDELEEEVLEEVLGNWDPELELLPDDDELLEDPVVVVPPQPTSAIDAKAGMNQREM